LPGRQVELEQQPLQSLLAQLPPQPSGAPEHSPAQIGEQQAPLLQTPLAQLVQVFPETPHTVGESPG
jgi:hypothetical protein